ncbi:MAG TPA: hypothetical protein VE713_18710 [Pyrinomonadaceae bacterium]|nr:hypothetical protein [Pyrinomonadaceae bacterium]
MPHLRIENRGIPSGPTVLDELANAAFFTGLLLALFPRLTPVESLMADDANAPAPVVFRIRIERATGLREG